MSSELGRWLERPELAMKNTLKILCLAIFLPVWIGCSDPMYPGDSAVGVGAQSPPRPLTVAVVEPVLNNTPDGMTKTTDMKHGQLNHRSIITSEKK